MNDSIHCILLNHSAGSNPEQEIVDKLKEILDERNTKGIQISRALQDLGIGNVSDCVIGPNHIAILCEDGGVRRIGFQSKVQQVPTSSNTNSTATNISQSTSAAQVSAAACSLRNAAKFRRVMLSGLRRGERTGVIIDRGRPLIPASSVPEDLIAQAQVVLQGKSREVIIRELQRTNLNVNEAVNNLLSRDDDDADGEESAGEVVLPEELLSLLDPSSHNLLEASDLYSEFDYVHLREASRKQREKDRKTKDGATLSTPTTINREELNATIQPWRQDGEATPKNVLKFIKIAATKKEVVCLTSCGKIYSWEWSSRYGDDAPNCIASRLLDEKDFVTDIASSVLRIAAVTKDGKVCTWLTHTAVGHRACRATEVKNVRIPMPEEEDILELCVSDLLVVLRTTSGFFWCGLYPFNDRPKIWEKERAKSRKHVTFDTTTSEIKEGCEVRTKSCPIYAAGSVALNINGDKASIGVLMESVWTLTEICRFRVFEPSYYDADIPDGSKVETTPPPLPGPGESRKRRASSELFANNPAPREEPWSVSDVIWIHEQSANDCAIVKITDGAYCGIEYSPPAGESAFASNLSGSLNSKEQTEKLPGKIRLLRKDDLCIVTPKMKSAHSPRNMQKEPLRFSISSTTNRRVISAVADTTGVRCLVEKRGKLYITRVSITGKILSEHFLPIHLQSLYGVDGKSPKLFNYGVDFLLFLRDGNGSIVPLVRDAARGFKEPAILNTPPIKMSSLNVNLTDMTVGVGISKSWSKRVSLVMFSGPTNEAVAENIPSLMQTILYCDANGLQRLLNKIAEINNPDLIMSEIVNSRCDGGSNVLHAALRLTIAKKNKDDVDGGTVHGIRLRDDETRMAREEAKDLDQKWQRLIRQNRVEAAQRENESVIQAVLNEGSAEAAEVPGDVVMTEPAPSHDFGTALNGTKERQKGALDVVKVLLEHSVIKPILHQLLTHRDYHGLTPFQAALNSRAFGAAAIIWTVIDGLEKDEALLTKMINPPGSRPDDSPLFLLCYNDTCSFSWTGEEHINQDIFECRTCGLTGSLCCCTECAFTCHRNHDCKLKKTSPTAYCDCWEKCACKALVAGNQEKREFLLRELLKKTRLHESTNNRGEHVLLFLARTYGRQQNEQSHFTRRKPHPVSQGDNSATPEHDLDPPRFARFALDVCLNEWNVVKSLVNIGIRNMPSDNVLEDAISLNSQHGSTHLDKFVFVLFSRCSEQAGVQLIDSMIMASNVSDKSREPGVDQVISRFARSLIRLFTLCVLISPTAASVAVRGLLDPAPLQTEKRTNANVQSLSLSGFFSLVRNDLKAQEPKGQAVTTFIFRIRSALIRLGPYSITEAAYSADAILTPARLGILKPSTLAGLSSNQDCMEVIEKFLNSESDLTSHLSRPDDSRDRPSKKKKNNKKENDKSNSTGENRKDDSEGDSDSDEDGQSSRRHNSQSGMEESVIDVSVGTSEPSAPRRKIGIAEVLNEVETDETSSDSESDEDEVGHVLIDIDDNIDDEETDEAGEQAYEPSSPRNEQDANATFSIREEGDVFMNDPENEEENTGDGEDANRTIDSSNAENAPNVPEPPESAEEQQEEQENTRDAVLSEASSVDQPDAREDSTARSRRYRMSAGGRNSIFRRHNQVTNNTTASGLEWTRRTFPNDEEFDTSIRSRISKSTDRIKKKNGDPLPSSIQTGVELATSFSFLVRLIDDLIMSMCDPALERSNINLNLRKEYLKDIMDVVIRKLEPSWSWLSVAMDRMESQLLFGNAIIQNTSGEIKPKQNKKKDPAKKEKVSEDPSTAALRRESLSYIIGTMRAQSREAGDDFPCIETENVRMLVFVFDAYLMYHDTLEKIKNMSQRNLQPSEEDPATSALTVQRFFKRSDSLCFPGALSSGAWDTLDNKTTHIPLAEKPYLLIPEAERDALFAPHREPFNFTQYKQNFLALGTANILSMSLSDPHPDWDMFNQADMDISSEDLKQTFDMQSYHNLKYSLRGAMSTPLNKSLSRWKNVVQYMAKECYQTLLDTYGGDPGDSPILLHIASFSVKQKMFRSALERVKCTQTKDIVLDVHRDPQQLIRGTVFQLNKAYVRRLNVPKTKDSPQTVMGFARVKVRFHDEPGEGSGVARSYYTALAEALQNLKVFPFDDYGWEGEDFIFGGSDCSASQQSNSSLSNRERVPMNRLALMRERSANTILSRRKGAKRYPLNVNSAPYIVEDIAAAESRVASVVIRNESRNNEEAARDRPALAEAIFCRVRSMKPVAAARITGMIVDIPTAGIFHLVNNFDILRHYVDDAVNLMLQTGLPSDLALLNATDEKIDPQPVEHPDTDDFPLFAKSCRGGNFVVPLAGNLSPMRLNTFRNVGRIIGLCLAQGELFPLKLCRHVFKYILERPIGWLDVQFYDLQLFNGLRHIISSNDEDFETLALRFLDDLSEPGSYENSALKPNGENIPVTKENVIEYVYRLVHAKLLGPRNTKCLQAIKQGVHDVLPAETLKLMNAEDLRLVLCGTETICMTTLQSRTSFSDESHSSVDTIDKFKEWFWSVFESLSNQEKQDLLFFWTGAPSLPPSSYPYPTVMVRPPDDIYLPTANTCISRLYVPLYSTKKILKNKLLLAIKAKNFGFV